MSTNYNWHTYDEWRATRVSSVPTYVEVWNAAREERESAETATAGNSARTHRVYIVCGRDGPQRMCKRKPTLSAVTRSQIVVALDLEVPDACFQPVTLETRAAVQATTPPAVNARSVRPLELD